MKKNETILTPAQLAAFKTACLEFLVDSFNENADPGDDPVAYSDVFVFNYYVRSSGVADLFYYVNDDDYAGPNFPICYAYPSGKVVDHSIETLDDCYTEKATDGGKFEVTYTVSSFEV